jgi:hypothetical protein
MALLTAIGNLGLYYYTITIVLFKGLKKIESIGNLVDSMSRGVVFRLQTSLRIRSQNRNGFKVSVSDLCGMRIQFMQKPHKIRLLAMSL